MRDRRLTFLRFFPWLLLLPLLPACSLVQAPQSLEGFPPGTLQEIRQQVTELGELQKLDGATPTQRQHMQNVQRSLQQFERDTIRAANRLEKQDDWRSAKQVLQGAARVLPHSEAIESAQQQLAARRQLHEARVRMELEIHRGEQLLKDAESYRRLQRLKEPGALTWLELKNYDRHRRASAQSLQQFALRALQRETPQDTALAQKALKIARGLYGDDLQRDTALRESLDHDLAQANRRLRRDRPQPVRATQQKQDEIHIAELQRALEAGDLPGARQPLEWLRQHSPQHPQLLPLQSRFRMQLSTQVDTAITRGNHLYSQGEIERALQVWREANALDPDNVELLGNIARAEKVLENLRALSAPAGTSP